jgi:pyruvate ferredoxin oxidoreductase gamma subunit
LPQFLRDKCIDCAQCELACPDFCFVWEEGTDKRGRPVMVLKGIDYQYCKGCLKCVEVCPTEALITVEETDGFTQEHGVAHFWKRNGVAVG